MRAVQILVDGFAISSLYGLAAVGFTLIFGVSGVLNLAHGGIMVVAALVGWAAAAADVALTPVTIPFAEAYVKKHGVTPAYVGYSAYDMVYVIAEAIARAGGSTDPDKLVTALEATDHVGTVGRIQFYGRDNQFTTR